MRFMANKGIEVDYDSESDYYYVTNEKGDYMESKNMPKIGCRVDEDSQCVYEDKFDLITCFRKRR